MAVRRTLAADKPDLAPAVLPVQAAAPVRSGGSDVGSPQGAGDRTGSGPVRLRYVARGIGVYDALVCARHADGTVDVEILSDRGSSLLTLHGIRVVPAAEARPGECFQP